MALQTVIVMVAFGLVASASAMSPLHPPVAQTSPSPAVYQALGVLELEANPSQHDLIMSTMLDLIPDINRMMQAMTINSTIYPNSTETERLSRVDHIIKTSIAMCRLILETMAEAEGRGVSTEDLEKLKTIEVEAYNMATHYMANYLSTLPNCYCSGVGKGESPSSSSPSVSVSGSASSSFLSAKPSPSAATIVKKPTTRVSSPTSVKVQAGNAPTANPNLPENHPFNSLSKLLTSLTQQNGTGNTATA